MRPAAATYWVQATPGVNYVRAELPARHLPGVVADASRIQSHNAFKYLKPAGDGEKRVAFTDQKGPVAIWMFPGNHTRGIFMREQQQNGLRVLVEVDDLYRTHPPDENLSEWREKISDPVNGKPVSYEAHERIVGNKGNPWIDGVIVSTPQLACEYADLHPNIYVCPNCVDPDDWSPEPPHQQGGVLRVGWAASDSHGIDIPLVHGALSFASRQPNVEVVLIGINTYKPTYPHTFIPFAPLEEYRRNLANIDVMLCPLLPGRWADCKSDLKAMEAGMAGAMPIVSRRPPYEPWFDNLGAFVADDKHDFIRLVRLCCDRRDMVREKAEAARDYVMGERTIQKNVWRWREACAVGERELVSA